jgi:hypothetical protein
LISSAYKVLAPRQKQGSILSPGLSPLAPHFVILIFCFGILVGATVLSSSNSGSGSGSDQLKLGPLPIPHSCIFNKLTGLPCPGCGLTRSMVATMHGDFAGSFTYHRLGLITLFYVFFQFFYRLAVVAIPKWRRRNLRFERWLNQGIVFLGGLFLFNWILTLV